MYLLILYYKSLPHMQLVELVQSFFLSVCPSEKALTKGLASLSDF